MTDSDLHDDLPDEELPDTDFDWLANVYNRHGAINHPSELHGLILGEIVGSMKRTPGDWLAQVLEHMGVDELDSERQANVAEDLIAFYQKVSESIDKDSSSFSLLLPDDDYNLPERIDSLVVWVRGFLEGVAVAASDRLAKIGEDLEEILRDFVEICQLDSRVVQDESGEKEFFEIAEYVRIGVLNLYAEFNEPKVDPKEAAGLDSTNSNPPTLH